MKLLFNTVGNVATSLTHASFGAAASGYSATDLVSGPRSTFFRTTASTGQIRIAYDYSAAMNVDFFAIARADKLITQQGINFKYITKNSGGTWSVTSIVNPLTTSSLIGPTVGTKTVGQDYVYTWGSTQTSYGYGIEMTTAGGSAEAMMISKLYVGQMFSFDSEEVEIGAGWEDLSESERRFRPMRGSFEYDTEKRIALSWNSQSKATTQSFIETANLLTWPLFLYDPNQYVFAWKLEHVLIEDYTVELAGPDNYDISIIFRRLAHYD